jgi:enterochelin esterase-like enzyme
MTSQKLKSIYTEQKKIRSVHLRRQVVIDFYLPLNTEPRELSLLLINDGQDLDKMGFKNILDGLMATAQISPLLAVGIHAGDRFSEYGIAGVPDYKRRGEKAFAYQQFLIKELVPLIHINYKIESFKSRGIAGFSLGGLSAFDTAWNYPEILSVAGIFSGSFWWRSKDLDEGYDEDRDRIMHQKIKNGSYHPDQRFYFTTGSLDETADRNNNGVIDSIDDTMAIISELQHLGFNLEHNIRYINYEDGKHDVETWGKAMPAFLLWGWSKK